MSQSKKVSEKSTKPEIWQAYNELMEDLNTTPIEFTSPEKEDNKENFIKTITDLKLTISDNLDKIANNLLKSLNDAEAFRINLEKERSQIVENIRQKKDSLESEIESVKNEHLEIEKQYQKNQILIQQEKEIERQHEEDEYLYELAIKRRQENDTYETKKTAEIAKLKEREEIITAREKEIAEMEKTIAEIPKTIEESTSKAKAELANELMAKFTAEITSLKIETEHQKNISEIKTKNLESLIKTQEQEMTTLHKQLADSSSQLKEMAVAVIGSGSSKEKTPSQTPTNE